MGHAQMSYFPLRLVYLKYFRIVYLSHNLIPVIDRLYVVCPIHEISMDFCWSSIWLAYVIAINRETFKILQMM